jgi:hypothetical protein
MTTTPARTCPRWCQRHEVDPNEPTYFAHIATVATDLTLGGNSHFNKRIDVEISQASDDGSPSEIWFDAESYSAAQARRLAAALIEASELVDQERLG